MADAITATTAIVDRDGRRVRYYVRKNMDRPGAQARRLAAARGLRWCLDCHAWLASADVLRGGRCREHERAAYRAYYAGKGGAAIRAQKYARKRGLEKLPPEAEEMRLEDRPSCVYCGAPGESWDHVVPVSRGGRTVPGNLVRACISCNSSKNDREVSGWLASRGWTASDDLIDEIVLGFELGTSCLDLAAA